MSNCDKCDKCENQKVLFEFIIYCGLHYTFEECEKKGGFKPIPNA